MSFFTALFSGHKKSAALLTPPDGMRETDIAAFYRSYGFSYTGKFDK